MDIDILRKYLSDTKNDWNYITPVDFFNNYFNKNKDYMLIDLRKEEDFKKANIRSAKNIFWLDLLNQNRQVFLVLIDKLFST